MVPTNQPRRRLNADTQKGSPETKREEKEIRAYYWKVVRHMLSTIALTEFLADNSEDV
jgi:hypothetical protein